MNTSLSIRDSMYNGQLNRSSHKKYLLVTPLKKSLKHACNKVNFFWNLWFTDLQFFKIQHLRSCFSNLLITGMIQQRGTGKSLLMQRFNRKVFYGVYLYHRTTFCKLFQSFSFFSLLLRKFLSFCNRAL